MGWFHILAFKGIPHGDADSYLSQKFKKSMELMSWKFYSFHVIMMILRFVQGLER